MAIPDLHSCKSVFRMSTIAIALSLACLGASGQVANATALVGNVVDSSGLPVIGAKVTAVNEETRLYIPEQRTARGTTRSLSSHLGHI